MHGGGNPASSWHLITGEYPPQPGGVSDYTRRTARGLAAAGDAVHVWAPWCGAGDATDPGVSVHRLPGRFGPRGLAALDAGIRRSPGRILVQYVPHAFGWKAMNVPFCLWLHARRRWPVWVMFHEVAFPMRPGQPWRRNLLGRVHGHMARLLLRSAERVFLSIPGWEPLLRGLAGGACPPMSWLPVPSNLDARPDLEVTACVRKQLASGADAVLIGSFGTYGPMVGELLAAVLPPLLERTPGRVGLLLGRGGDGFARALEAERPALRGRLVAPGGLPDPELAAHLAACDLLIQPYPDGVSSRRGSMMAGLSLGIPVVTTEGALTEPLWRDGGAVALTSVGRSPDLVAAAEELLAEPARRAALGRRGRDFYREHFAPERLIRRLRGAAGPAAAAATPRPFALSEAVL